MVCRRVFISESCLNTLKPYVIKGKEIKKVRQGLVPQGIEESVSPKDIDLSSFSVHDSLNPDIWDNEDKLNSRVRLKLLDLADDFVDTLKVDWVSPEDILLTGSIAGYNYYEGSDIDIHIVMDFKKVDKRTEFVENYFKTMKWAWDSEHEKLNIFGHAVEFYVEDVDKGGTTNGIYSLEKNKWIKRPSKETFDMKKVDTDGVKGKVSKYMNDIDKMDALLKGDDEYVSRKVSEIADKVFDKIVKGRKTALKDGGETSTDNIVFKTLRRNTYLDKLSKIKTLAYDKENSINEGF